MNNRFLRLPAVKTATASSRSSIYLRINEGLFPKPIRLGLRAVAWIESEISAINAARIRGASDDEIRALVRKLETERKRAA